jgi:hypothetical protein
MKMLQAKYAGLSLVAVIGFFMAGVLGTARAATYYWDSTATAGYQPGTNTWESAFWSLNGTSLVTWPGGSTNNAFFGTSAGANAVTISGTVDVNQLGLGWTGAGVNSTFNSISNGTLRIGAGGVICAGDKNSTDNQAIWSDVVLTANQVWNTTAALWVHGAISGNYTLTKVNTAGNALNVYSGNSTYSGGTLFNGGVIKYLGSASGTPLGTGGITFNSGTTTNASWLYLTPGGSGSAIALTGGTDGGNLIAFDGYSRIYLAKGSQSSVSYTFGNAADTGSVFSRLGKGTLSVGNSTTANPGGVIGDANGKILIANGATGVPSCNGMVDAYITTETMGSQWNFDFLQYDAVNGLANLSYDLNAPNAKWAGVQDNTKKVKVPNATYPILTNSASIYALNLQQTSTLTLSNNAVLSIGNGVQPAGLIVHNGPIRSAGDSLASKIDFGTSEGIIYNGQNATIATPIDGSAGVTVNAGGGNTIALTLTAANTYTGPTTILYSGLTLTNGGSLAAGSPVTVYNGGVLNVNSGGTVNGVITNNGTVTVNAGACLNSALANNGTATVNGGTVGSILNSGTLTINCADVATVGSQVTSSGAGTISSSGNGTATLNMATGSNSINVIKNVSTTGTLILNGAGSTNVVATLGYNTGKAWTLTVNGGVWNVGTQGFNGTGSQNGGTFNINGGANYTVTSMRYGAHGTFNVGGVGGSGTLNLVDPTSENGPGLGFAVNALNQGIVSLGARLGTFTLSLSQNNTVAVTNSVTVQSGGSITVPGNMTLGGGTAMGAGGSEYDYVSLVPGGKLLVSGTIAVNAPAVSANTTRAFFWTGGQLTALAVTPSTNFNGVGSSIDSNSLMNIAGTLAPGDLGTPGKTTVNGGYSNALAAVLALDIGGTTQASAYTNAANYHDYVNVSGGAALMAGRLDVNLINAYVPATTVTKFTVLAATGSAGALAGGFSNVPDGKVWCADGYSRFDVLFNTAAKTVILSNYSANAWNQTSGGTWDSASNWKLADPSGSDMAAVFGTALSSSGQVTLDVARTVRGLLFTNSAASYTIAGAGSLTLQGDALTAPRLAVAAGSHTISVPLALTGATTIAVDGLAGLLSLTGGLTGGQAVTKTGTGTLALGGVNTLGTVTVSAGTVRLASGTTTANSLTLAPGATFDFVAGTLYIQKGVAGGAIDTVSEVNAAITANTITLRGSNATPADFKVTEETIRSAVYVKVMKTSTGTLIRML